MSGAPKICSKPMILSKLGSHYLNAGIAVTLANNLYHPGSYEDRHHLLVVDDQPDIHGPNELPENWPVGIIRVYKEIHIDRNRKIELDDLNLDSIPPSRVGLNSDTVGYSEGIIFDRKGILAYEVDLMKKGKGLALQGLYLMIDDTEQLSLIPSLAEPQAFSVGDLLDALPKGLLDGYYKSKFTSLYEENRIRAELATEEFQALHGLGQQYLNWEMANALLASISLTALQHKKSTQQEETPVSENKTHKVTLDLNDPDPKGATDTITDQFKDRPREIPKADEVVEQHNAEVEEIQHFGSGGKHMGKSIEVHGGPHSSEKDPGLSVDAGEVEVERLRTLLKDMPDVYSVSGVTRVDVVAEVESDYKQIEDIIWAHAERLLGDSNKITKIKALYDDDDRLVLPSSFRSTLDETGREVVIALYLQNDLNEQLNLLGVNEGNDWNERPSELFGELTSMGSVHLLDERSANVQVMYWIGDSTNGFRAGVHYADGTEITQYNWEIHEFMAKIKALIKIFQ